MKKLFSLTLILSLAIFSYAQQEGEAFVKGNEKSMLTAKNAGVFEFKLPATATKEKVEQNKAYYTDYFTVEYKPQIQIAIIKMVDNTAASRRVITRFLVSNGVKTIVLGNDKFTVSEFYEKFLK